MFSVSVDAPGRDADGHGHRDRRRRLVLGSGGRRWCSITLTTAGSRTLVATYLGDTNFLGSTSAGVHQTVRARLDHAPRSLE